LLKCQVRRLYTLAQNVLRKAADSQSCFLWIDTLCVPRQQPFRKLAISQICTSFDKATAVLVLDSELQQISIQSPVPELLVRVSYCGWMRRVWMLLEGSLAAPALHVQFDGGALDLGNAVDRKENLEKKATRDICTGIRRRNLLRGFTVMRLRYQRWSSSSADAHALGFALHGVGGRSTSRKGDDYLCLGILMGLNPKQSKHFTTLR